jgi:hypothetical protein
MCLDTDPDNTVYHLHIHCPQGSAIKPGCTVAAIGMEISLFPFNKKTKELQAEDATFSRDKQNGHDCKVMAIKKVFPE